MLNTNTNTTTATTTTETLERSITAALIDSVMFRDAAGADIRSNPVEALRILLAGNTTANTLNDMLKPTYARGVVSATRKAYEAGELGRSVRLVYNTHENRVELIPEDIYNSRRADGKACYMSNGTPVYKCYEIGEAGYLANAYTPREICKKTIAWNLNSLIDYNDPDICKVLALMLLDYLADIAETNPEKLGILNRADDNASEADDTTSDDITSETAPATEAGAAPAPAKIQTTTGLHDLIIDKDGRAVRVMRAIRLILTETDKIDEDGHASPIATATIVDENGDEPGDNYRKTFSMYAGTHYGSNTPVALAIEIVANEAATNYRTGLNVPAAIMNREFREMWDEARENAAAMAETYAKLHEYAGDPAYQTDDDPDDDPDDDHTPNGPNGHDDTASETAPAIEAGAAPAPADDHTSEADDTYDEYDNDSDLPSAALHAVTNDQAETPQVDAPDNTDQAAEQAQNDPKDSHEMAADEKLLNADAQGDRKDAAEAARKDVDDMTTMIKTSKTSTTKTTTEASEADDNTSDDTSAPVIYRFGDRPDAMVDVRRTVDANADQAIEYGRNRNHAAMRALADAIEKAGSHGAAMELWGIYFVSHTAKTAPATEAGEAPATAPAPAPATISTAEDLAAYLDTLSADEIADKIADMFDKGRYSISRRWPVCTDYNTGRLVSAPEDIDLFFSDDKGIPVTAAPVAGLAYIDRPNGALSIFLRTRTAHAIIRATMAEVYARDLDMGHRPQDQGYCA